MKKNKFIKSTLILISGGFITKILGMVIRVIETRLLGKEGVGMYMLLNPTFSLLIALAQLGLPVAISKLVAEEKNNNKKLVLGVIPISLIINSIIIIILIFSSEFIAENLLNEPRLDLSIIMMGLVLPFISISSILRGYFFGKNKMIPHVLSNIVEDIIRLIILIIGIPIFLKYGLKYTICFVVSSNIISEITSILVFMFFLPKKTTIQKEDFTLTSKNLKSIFNLSLPTVGSRLIGSVGYFFEPIIISTVLLKVGYSNYFIVSEYGVLNGYVMPILLLPSFFTSAISQALIPVVSNSYTNKMEKYAKKKIDQAIFISLMIGVVATAIFLIFPKTLLKLLYNTEEGLTYLKVLAPIFLLHYIQGPLVSSLQAMGKAKEAMVGTIIGMTIRTIFLAIFATFKIGLWCLVLAISLNIITVTLYDIKKVRDSF